MIIFSLCFKSISFPAGNIAIIRASRVASAALMFYDDWFCLKWDSQKQYTRIHEACFMMTGFVQNVVDEQTNLFVLFNHPCKRYKK